MVSKQICPRQDISIPVSAIDQTTGQAQNIPIEQLNKVVIGK